MKRGERERQRPRRNDERVMCDLVNAQGGGLHLANERALDPKALEASVSLRNLRTMKEEAVVEFGDVGE